MVSVMRQVHLKVQTVNLLKQLVAEVQKGNAIEERKIQRLFRNGEVTRLIKENQMTFGGWMALLRSDR